MSRLTIGVAAAAMMSMPACPARAATIVGEDVGATTQVLALRGVVGKGDATALRAAVEAANREGRTVTALRLDSPGGNVGEAWDLALVIRAASLPTVVVNGSTCASACFVPFAAGARRYASRGAHIGVHSASEDGRETFGSNAVTTIMARMLHALAVPDAIVGRMATTQADDIAWLGEGDLSSMGVTLTGRPNQLASLPAAAPEPSAGNDGKGDRARDGDARPLTIRRYHPGTEPADAPPGDDAHDGDADPVANASMTLPHYVAGAGPAPRRFEDLPSGDPYVGPYGDEDFGPRGSPHHDFRTALREAAERGANFAGRYAITLIGCGAGCRSVWVLDVPTGRVFRPDLGRTLGDYGLSLDWRPYSNLVRAHWISGDPVEGDCVVFSAVWDGRVLRDRVEQWYGPASTCEGLAWGR